MKSQNEAPAVVLAYAPGKPWASSESYWRPLHVVESGWIEHAPFAFWLMSALRPGRVVELGTHSGYSYFAFCETVRRLGLRTEMIAIDTWKGDDHAGFYDESIFNMVQDINRNNYAGFSTLLRGYFDEHLAEVKDRSIDLLHIDGRHGHEDVTHDFQTWLPKMSGSGVVLFHDIEVRERGFGVWRLWNEVSAKYPSFSFKHGNGLGIIAPGGVIPEAIRSLVEAEGSTISEIREFYSTLGGAISEQENLVASANEHQADVIRMLQEEISRLEVSRNLAESESAQLRESNSWKFTRPLRAASSLIHRDTK